MTRDQTDSLLLWLLDGYKVLKTIIEAGTTAPQSRPEPQAATMPDNPSPAVVCAVCGHRATSHGGIGKACHVEGCSCLDYTLKRKRGRPRKSAVTTAPAYLAEPERTIPEDETFQCRYCRRELPETIRQTHEQNCRIAAQGYASHEATPGTRGRDDL